MTNAGVAQLVEQLIYDQRAGVRVRPPAPVSLKWYHVRTLINSEWMSSLRLYFYGLEVENVLLRTLWVKRNVGLAHHHNH